MVVGVGHDHRIHGKDRPAQDRGQYQVGDAPLWCDGDKQDVGDQRGQRDAHQHLAPVHPVAEDTHRDLRQRPRKDRQRGEKCNGRQHQPRAFGIDRRQRAKGRVADAHPEHREHGDGGIAPQGFHVQPGGHQRCRVGTG